MLFMLDRQEENLKLDWLSIVLTGIVTTIGDHKISD